jgi:hypothetical protein
MSTAYRCLRGGSLVAVLATGLIIGCGGGGDDDCQPLSSVLASYDVGTDSTIPAGCWLVEDHLVVYNGAALTIAPGAELRFGSGFNLEVDEDAALAAAGTAAQPILLTGQVAQRGFWGGVIFSNSASPLNELSYVTVEYAGSNPMLDAAARPFRTAVALDSSGFPVQARISNSTIRECSGFGLYLHESTTTLGGFAGNVITANASGAVFAYAPVVHLLDASSSYAGNDEDRIFVDAAYEFGEADRAWATLDAPYHVDGVFILYSHLTLAAGSRLYFTAGSGIRVINELAGITAVGTAEAPILFSGTEGTPGHWNGLYFANTDDVGAPRSRFEHVTIEYGGGYAFLDSNAEEVSGNLLLDSSGWGVDVQLSNVTLTNSSGYGLWLDCLAQTSGDTPSFSGNALGDSAREDNCS